MISREFSAIMKQRISIIAAMTEDRVIGRDNKLPWHIPEDLKRFKNLTTGHPVIMGRRTFESIGRLLPGRTNISISRDLNYAVEDAVIVHSLEEALVEAESAEGSEEIFIIGGGQIFTQAIGMADRLYLTIVHARVTGDAYFPEYQEFGKVVERDDHGGDKYDYTFLTLEK